MTSQLLLLIHTTAVLYETFSFLVVISFVQVYPLFLSLQDDGSHQVREFPAGKLKTINHISYLLNC